MTEYERLSLSLLSMIASGIGHQLTGATLTTPDLKERHAEQVLRWQNVLNGILDKVRETTEGEGEAHWR